MRVGTESSAPPVGAPGAALGRIRRGLEPVARELEAAGMPAPAWEGKLIRPLVGYAAAVGEADSADGGALLDGDRVWYALAAVQLAHEASLIHDDVIDGASERRSRPTVAASRGAAAAIVEGDHLLTAAYRLAVRTGSLEWADLFARAVERTVAGEKAQARRAGSSLEWSEYEAVVVGKSGELLGAAMAAGPTLRGEWAAHRWYEAGRRVGLIYQMLDDLLDYCPHVETGKPSLADYRRGLWTWPRAYLDLPAGLSDGEALERLGAPGDDGVTPLERALTRFRAEAASVAREVTALMPGDELVTGLLEEWLDRAGDAVATSRRVDLPAVSGWESLMAEHARSFRFASRLFPAERRAQVTGVYAWCRYTDDLVDASDLPAPVLEARLDAWLGISRRAYDGEATGNALADRVMTEMRAGGVPFGYAEALIEGMRMDVRGVEYGTLTELWTYTYRVASVVGLWLTELFGIRDPWLLDRAASLGHAMQLTNILRDVGEDLEAGRLYLPTSWLAAHELERSELERMARAGEMDDRYRTLIERLLRVADREYEHAAPAIDRLPDFYRRPVAVAAEVYRGIHQAIRANDYDNLSRRAHTSTADKLKLGAGALLRSRPPRRADRAEGEADSRSSLRGALARAAVFGLSAALLFGASAGTAAAQESGRAVESGPALAGADGRPAAVRVEPVAMRPATATARAFLRIVELWLQAVDQEAAVYEGLAAVTSLRARLDPTAPAQDRLLRAYRGSFHALRAKHGGWPGERLRALREGFELMDTAVDEAPDDAAVRYVRLMSGFYLPGFFGRGDEVDADMAALIRLLPGARRELPAELYPAAVAFVLEHGRPAPAARATLEGLLP
ncbi:MAG: squalene/phytoene synthase family protein [Longimicrobiales bacterium]